MFGEVGGEEVRGQARLDTVACLGMLCWLIAAASPLKHTHLESPQLSNA